MSADDGLFDRDLQTEQVRMHGANLPLALGGSALVASAAAWVAHLRVPQLASLRWLGAMFALYVMLGALGWSRRRAPAALPAARWLQLFRASVALHGLAWGSSALILLAQNDSAQQSFMVMVLVGVAAGGQTMVVLDVMAAWLFVVPVLLPAVLWLLQIGGTLPVASAGLVAAYIALMAANAHTAYRRELDYFRLRQIDRHHMQMLQQSKQAAEAANQAKSRFMSHMSHELRTPLNAVLGFSQLLQTDDRPPLAATQRQWVDDIRHAGEHLLDLINDVLDLSLLESGRLKVSLEPVDASTLVQTCVRQVTPMAQSRGIVFELGPMPANGACVSADAMRLRQVLLNLLSNAIKYNRIGGQVRIDFHTEAESLRLTVADEGAGLNEAQVRRLFTAFDRLEAERLGVAGTGIGLALSRQLMTLMGGEIGAESFEGRGSVFWLRVPSAERPPLPVPREAVPLARAGSADPLSVIYVEDNPVNRLLMEAAFARRTDLRLLTLELAEAGLAMAEELRPDLMLVDIQLPGLDGYGLLERLRSQDSTRHIPVIALSANAMPQDVRRGLAAGFTAYLSKPVDFERLFALIDQTPRAKGLD